MCSRAQHADEPLLSLTLTQQQNNRTPFAAGDTPLRRTPSTLATGGAQVPGRPPRAREAIFSSRAGEKLQVFLLLQKSFINRSTRSSTAAPDRADVPCFQCTFTQSHETIIDRGNTEAMRIQGIVLTKTTCTVTQQTLPAAVNLHEEASCSSCWLASDFLLSMVAAVRSTQ